MTQSNERLVDRVQTLCTPAQLGAALYDAWGRLIQESRPTRASVLVLLAHWALETGFGRFCWCWNIGNKKRVPGRPYYQVRCSEIIDGVEQWFDPPHPQTSFIAYSSLQEGADDYLTGLRGMFRAAWPAVVAGDPALFCHMLKLSRYYTASEAVYTDGVCRCFLQLDHVIPAGEPDPQDIARAALDEATVTLDLAHADGDPPPADTRTSTSSGSAGAP